MSTKADYVRAQPQTRNHRCHWPGCDKQVPPAMWGCKCHWFALPAALRAKVWRAYAPGQEVNGTPSDEYMAVAREVQDWIAARGTHGVKRPVEETKPAPSAPMLTDRQIADAWKRAYPSRATEQIPFAFANELLRGYRPCGHCDAPLGTRHSSSCPRFADVELVPGIVGSVAVVPAGVPVPCTRDSATCPCAACASDRQCVSGVEASNPWKDAVLDALANCCMDAPLDEEPRSILKRVIAWEVMVALDPAVSSEAQALIDRGRAEVAAGVHPVEGKSA